jgi:hypothetical protein
MINMATNYKKQFEEIYATNVKREGADAMLAYLHSTDFFTAPASTKFHGNHAGGLVEHCVKVYQRFYKMLDLEYGAEWLKKPENLESITLIALLHDICKINCYKIEMRNQKIDGEWVQKPIYVYDDALPYGHGEKSVYIISAYMKLSREEAFAINWHMGGFDPRNLDGKFTVASAFRAFPITVIFHAADMMSSYLDEKTTKN